MIALLQVENYVMCLRIATTARRINSEI